MVGVANIGSDGQCIDPDFQGSILELHVPDFDVVKSYYFGMEYHVLWEREPEGRKGYLVMQREAHVLCFWGGNGEIVHHEYFGNFPSGSRPGFRVEIVIMVSGIEDFFARVKERANVVESLHLKPWGVRDFRCADPNGFYLRFSERHDIRDSKYAVP